MIGRSLISRHRLDHLAVEQLRHGADADDAGRPQRLDRLDEGRDRRPVLRERLLKVRQIGARGHQQAVDVEQRIAAAAPRVEIHALPRHGEADQLGDAGRGRSGAEKQEALVGELLPGDAQGGEDAGQRDAGGALDVVVEGADLVAIARQDRDGVDVGEVLPLDAAFRIELPAPPRRTRRRRPCIRRRARGAGAGRDRAGRRAGSDCSCRRRARSAGSVAAARRRRRYRARACRSGCPSRRRRDRRAQGCARRR